MYLYSICNNCDHAYNLNDIDLTMEVGDKCPNCSSKYIAHIGNGYKTISLANLILIVNQLYEEIDTLKSRLDDIHPEVN